MKTLTTQSYTSEKRDIGFALNTLASVRDLRFSKLGNLANKI